MKKLFLLAAVGLSWFVLNSQSLHAQYMPSSTNAWFQFAHFADGGPQTDKWITVFRFVNPLSITSQPITGTLSFFDSQGNPLALDFGNGLVTRMNVSIPAKGSIQLKSAGGPGNLKTGQVWGSFDAPVLAVEEFQNWRSGAFTNGASVTASGMTYAFQTYADRYTGVAVANPSEYVIRCSGTLTDNNGNTLGTKSFTLSGRGQTSFGVGDAFSLSSTSPASYLLTCTWTNTTINPAPAPFSALAIAGDSRGITSSMPPGDFAMPGSSYRMAWNAFYHLVKAFNSKSGFEVGQPVVRLLNDPIINATYDSANNIVTVNLALVELLADSPSEVAYVIAHALGHAHQRLAGNKFDPNVELDADQFSLFGLLFTGYDTYAAAGALGKLAVASEQTGLVSQLFDNLHEDLHKSFTTRMDLIMGESQTVCGSPQAADLCGMQHSLFHIHMP